jgi:NitT/TauT family transport system ATP-binding protein
VARIVARDVGLAYARGDGGMVAALDGMSLDVGDNEFVALVGPRGCGKSTFLYIVAGFIRATSGAVLVNDRPVGAPGPDRGMMFQHYALFPWRTVLGNVTYGLEERGLPRTECRERARSFIDLVKLGGFEDVYPNRLSGGMKQRVALARMLALDPDVLLMDEPFGALDAQTRRIMQEELLEIWSRRKKTVLFVTHDVQEAVTVAERVAVMTAAPGRIRALVEVRGGPGGARASLVEELWTHVREEVDRASALRPAVRR